MISSHRIADDLGRETIAGVTKAITLHGTSVSGFVRKVDNAPKSTVHTIAQNRLPPVKLDHTYRNI
jgi:hypothetical protein